MGYQESFVTTTAQRDFSKLLRRIRENGQAYYEDIGIGIPFIVTLQKKVENPEAMHIGMKLLYVTGERFPQKDLRAFLNITDENEDEQSIAEHDVESYFDDKMGNVLYDHDNKIYDGMKTEYVTVEAFSFDCQQDDYDSILAGAEKGVVEAMYELGLHYESIDREKSVQWLNKAADMGHADAQFIVGGQYKACEYEKTLALWRKSMEQGHGSAQEMLNLLEKSLQGDADALCELGNYYCEIARCEYPDHVPLDCESAVYWYKKAAAQGDADGKDCVAECEKCVSTAKTKTR